MGVNDDEILAVAHRESDEKNSRIILDLVINQGGSPPFNALATVKQFARIIRKYGGIKVTGDRLVFHIFEDAWEDEKIEYQKSELTAHQLYENLQVQLNTNRIVLLDVPKLESELLGLIWKGGKIDHPSGEHDDWSNAAAGVVSLMLEEDWRSVSEITTGGQRLTTSADAIGFWGDRRGGGLWEPNPFK